MKGMVFNSLQQFVEERQGIEIWDRAVRTCAMPSIGIYVSTKNYDDEELALLIAFLSETLTTAKADLVKAFGKYIFVELLAMAPEKAKQAENLKAFLLMVQNIIHAEVNKLYQDSNLPEFDYKEHKDTLFMIYRSPRKLCYFSEGLILGAADYFREQVTINQSKCMHTGAEYCQIEITFHE